MMKSMRRLLKLNHCTISWWNVSKQFICLKEISIDKSFLLWKGRLSWKQYIPNKRSRFGMKHFILSEADSDYVWNSIIYTGKELTTALVWTLSHFHYVATKVVLELMGDLLNKVYALFIDNWYTSTELAHVLLDNTTDSIGTLRKNCPQLPNDAITKKLKIGERVVMYEGSTAIVFTKWKDKKDVHLLSTFVTNGTVNVTRTGKEKEILLVVCQCNKKMGRVDHSDHIMTSYQAEKKIVKK